MNNLTASTGWRWVTQGFALFRKRPGVFSMLFTSYLMLQIILLVIPYVGNLVQPFLAPTFSMIFMTACAQIERNGALNPQQLRASFAPPVAQRLLKLGAIYLGTSLLMLLAVFAVFSLLGGGGFTELIASNQKIEATSSQNAGVLVTMVLFFILCMPAFWYAPPLIVWQQMPVLKAMFYSFFSVIRGWRAFIIYFLSWLLIGVLLPSMVAGLLIPLIGKGIAMMLLFVAAIMLTVAMYCSFYPTYVDVFGAPELPEA